MDSIIDFIKMNLGWIIIITGFFIPPVRDFVIRKFQLSVDKALEDKKSMNERKNYISKVKFDTEFKIYRELSETFFDMVKHISIMIPSGIAYVPADEEAKKEYDENNYDNALKAVVKAQDTLNRNAPFISEELYNEYSEILSLCKQQLDVFNKRWNILYIASQDEKERLSYEDYERTESINKMMKMLNNKIRKYISTLDVIE